MKTFECRFCLNQQKSDLNKCICSLCGRKMHELPYDRKIELQKEIIDYFKLAQVNLNDPFEFQEVSKMYSENSFPKFEEIYNMAFNKSDNRKHFVFLKNSIESIENYLFNNLTVKSKVSLDFLVGKCKKNDEVLCELLKILNLTFNEPVINNYPKTTAILQYKKKVDLLELCKEVLDLLKKLIDKISQHTILYNLNIFDNKKINKFSFKDEMSSGENLGQVIEHLDKIIKKRNSFDILSDGSVEYQEMNNAFWLAVNVLLKFASPEKKVIYVVADEEVDIKNEINNIFIERYRNINLEIVNKLELLDIDQTKELIDKLLETNFFEKLKISAKNVLQIGKAEKKLKALIGLDGIKTSIEKIKAYSIINKNTKNLNIHMCFLGNPGTGKTEVARLIADILYENKILPTNKVIETDRSGLVSKYLGETVHRTNEVIQEAMGGVLFVDEAYSLATSDGGVDYGHEAIAALIKGMEDYRGKFCVILAGYKTPMLKMIDTNPGFKSRIQFTLDFPNYSRDEMGAICKIILEKNKYIMAEDTLNKVLDIIDIKRKDENFANAREARNILEQVIMNQNLRVMDPNNKVLVIDDINKYILDNKISLPTSGKSPTSHILTPEEELDELIGLSSIKKTIKKIKAYAKKNKDDSNFNMHMCFYGNPGTGKTEVARIISRLLFEAGVLPEAKLVETDKTGLIGKYLGETEEKTKLKIESALGGVLFIDEAYALNEKNGSGDGFGKQAIDVLLKEMEDKRGQFCVVLAGYKSEMKELIAMNTGFASRIAFELEFPDFSRDELKEISKKMISNKKYIIDEDTLEKILDVVEFYRDRANFANARTLRNVVDQVIMNQNLRTEDDENNNEIILDDVLEYIEEEDINLPSKEVRHSSNVSQFDDLFASIVKTEIMYLSFNYSSMDKNLINQEYINEAIISISGQGGQGTGFIISPTGLAVTCNHCILNDGSNQKARVIVKTFDGKEMKLYSEFKVVAKDEINDIAIIKLTASAMMYKFIPLANKDFMYKPLLNFFTAGYPFGGETFEYISFSEGQVASINFYNNRKVVFANMFGKPGSSGSPIFDKLSNEVIGMYWGGISSPLGNDMINCFTSIDLIWNLLGSI